MKKMERWKRILLIIATAIILLRIGYIAIMGEVDKHYCISSSIDLTDVSSVPCQGVTQYFTTEEKRLGRLEFLFSNISGDKKGAVVLKIYSEGELIYQTNISLANIVNWQWKTVYVNAEMAEGKEYKIELSATEECEQTPDILVVKSGQVPEVISSYKGNERIEGELAIQYGYLKFPGIADRLVMISLWILLWIGIYGVLYYFNLIINQVQTVKGYFLRRLSLQYLVAVLEMIVCSIIINSSGIEFQAPTKVILYVVSLIAAIDYTKKTEYIHGLTKSRREKGLIWFLYLYAAFALVGQRIWIYPLMMRVTLVGLFVFACTILWFIPVVGSALYYIDKVCQCSFSKNQQMRTRYFAAVCVLLLLLPAAYNLFAFNPGISSPDTVDTMIGNAQHLQGMKDWHPAFYCMMLRLIENVWNSTYAVILVQYFFWAYVMTELLLYLRKKGMKESILLAVACFTGANAGNYIHINTIWKDIPYSLSLVWTLIVISKLVIDSEKYKRKWYLYVELVIALVGVYLYRKNGMVAFIVMVIPLAMVLRKNIRLILALAISILAVLVIKGPIYRYFEIQDTGKRGIYIGLGQDILGVYYASGEVSESTLQMINVMTEYNNAEYEYSLTWSKQSYDLAVEMKKFLLNYIDTFLKNPVMMTRAIIAREDALWNIFKGEGASLETANYTETMDGDLKWNENYPERKYVSLYPTAKAFSYYTIESQWISAIEWRCGLFTLIGLIAFVFMLLKLSGEGQKYLLLVTPLAGQIMSLLLSVGWSEVRYFWPLNLLNQALVLLVIVIVKKEARD